MASPILHRVPALAHLAQQGSARLVPAAKRIRDLVVQSVPLRVLIITACVSYLLQLCGIVLGWSLWQIGLVTLLPWLPVVARQTQWAYRHYHWLAYFYIVVIVQAGHLGEHLVQLIQVHLLHVSPALAHGIFGQLDVESVHLVLEVFLLISNLLLLAPYRQNRWLWGMLPLNVLHTVEHVVIFSQYAALGFHEPPVPAGLLAQGGLIPTPFYCCGGLPIGRADLHLGYNLLAFALLAIAFLVQLRQTHDAWLERAFPHLPTDVLVAATDHARVVRYAPGAVIVHQGQRIDRDPVYLVTAGQVAVSRYDALGRQALYEVLGPGQYVGGTEATEAMAPAGSAITVVARTHVSALAIDRSTFTQLVAQCALAGSTPSHRQGDRHRRGTLPHAIARLLSIAPRLLGKAKLRLGTMPRRTPGILPPG